MARWGAQGLGPATSPTPTLAPTEGYAVVADKLGYDTDDNKNEEQKHRGHEWEQRIADAVHALTG